jgi:hypothetical protein
MKSRGARRLLIILIGAGMLLGPSQRARAQTNSRPPTASLDAEEKESCVRNLRLIYDAIQAYQMEHKDIPNWLSDLVPQYLNDANVLICPVCRRTGKTEIAGLIDPKLPCSYLYEFCPLPLGSVLPDDPTRTRREWKRRQMGLVGSVVPIVRCRQHAMALNLSFEGKIYESPSLWENLLTNRVDITSLTPEKVFAGEGKGKSAKALTIAFPPRDTQAKAGELNLTAYYNAMLTDSWHGSTNNDLSALPRGLQTFDGVEYDVRGILQMGGKSATGGRFAPQVNGIPVRQKCQRLHFLHSAAFGSAADEGKQIGSYVLHYAANQMRLEIPIVYGRDVRDWHTHASEPPAAKELKVAWTGTNAVSKAAGQSIRLFETTWVNVAPDVEIESIDIVSGLTSAAPIVIAITAE